MIKLIPLQNKSFIRVSGHLQIDIIWTGKEFFSLENTKKLSRGTI